jgi:hypothetical protein
MNTQEVIQLIYKQQDDRTKTDFSLSRQGLRSLPPELGNLRYVTKLDLSRNQFISLPVEIGKLTELTHLDLAYNELHELPDSLANLRKLRRLDLRSNPLYKLPPVIYELPALTHLILERCYLLDLPAGLGKLEALQVLDLRDNQLRELPAEIGELRKLSRLIVYNNQLTELPGELGQLEELTEFLAYDNLIRGLPNEMGRLKKLMALNIDGNPIDSPGLRNALNLGLEDVLQYLRSKSVHHARLRLEAPFRLPFQQYLLAFREFCGLALDDVEFHFEVRQVPEGLELETQAENDRRLKRIDQLLYTYIQVVELVNYGQPLDRSLTVDVPAGVRNYLVVFLEHQIKHLNQYLKLRNQKVSQLTGQLTTGNRLENLFMS